MKRQDKSLSVSVVVPARNEEGNIEEIVKAIPQLGENDELIFVEGNSTDGTWKKIEEIAEKLHEKARRRSLYRRRYFECVRRSVFGSRTNGVRCSADDNRELAHG